MKLPEHYKLVYRPGQIRERLDELGIEIASWAELVKAETGEQVLAVCILRGAVFFLADLLRAIPETVEPTFCRAWSYSTATNEQSKRGVQVSVEHVAAEGRSLLLVDDICDTGNTLRALEKVFMDLGAREVRSAVLIRRLIKDAEYVPSWSAFDYDGEEWFVGYGLDDKNCYRNLPAVYNMKPDL
jgi:hypoxanthine phosphoribosyltransferase